MRSVIVHNRTVAQGLSRLSWFLLMLIGVAMIVGLYSIKARTLAAKTLVDDLTQTLDQERQITQMLAAEMAHLESPARLSALADTQLGLQPTTVERTLTIEQAVIELSPKLDAGTRGQK